MRKTLMMLGCAALVLGFTSTVIGEKTATASIGTTKVAPSSIGTTKVAASTFGTT